MLKSIAFARVESCVPTFVPTPCIEALLSFASAVGSEARKPLTTRNNAQELAIIVPAAKFLKMRQFIASNQ